MIRLVWLINLLFLLAACGPGDQPVSVTPAPLTVTPTPEVGVALITRAAPTVALIQTTPTPLPTATATPTATPIVYQIAEGDTLLGIAIENLTTVDEIKVLNPGVVPELLQIGQALVLPPPATPIFQGEASTPIPLQVTVNQVALYRTPVDSLWVLGEVSNEGEYPVSRIQVQIDLHGEEGQVVQTVKSWVLPSLVPAGARAPFGVLVEQVPSGDVQPSVAVIGGESLDDPGTYYSDLAVPTSEATIEEGRVQVEGQLENSGSQTAAGIMIVATFYDAEERVTGYAYQWLDETLPPGAILPFDLTAAPPGGQTVDYQLLVQGLRAEELPAAP